jgi:hypothetical protein
MQSLYSSEYREINVRFFLKSIYEFKLLVIAITLFCTLLASYFASNIVPIYKSEGLLKIGYYHELRDGNFLIKPLDSASDLTSKLSFIFLGKNDSKGWIEEIKVENQDRTNIEEYVRIESKGMSPESSANAIRKVVDYVQLQHGRKLDKSSQLLKISLGIIDAEIDAMSSKQNNILSDKASYSEQEFSSMIKTIKLMSIIDEDLGINYVSQKLLRKKYIELFLSDGYTENSSLVSDIYSPSSSISPSKDLIRALGFVLGLFISIGVVFSIKLFSVNKSD